MPGSLNHFKIVVTGEGGGKEDSSCNEGDEAQFGPLKGDREQGEETL